MKDAIIKGTGDSQFLKTALPSGTSWDDALAAMRAGTFPIDLFGRNSEGFQQEGTILNQQNLLSAETANALGLGADATPNDALRAVAYKTGSISLSTSWSGSGPYTQTVTVTGVNTTSRSRIDIFPDAATVSQLVTDGVYALYIDNDNGTLTAYAVGAAPTVSLTIQVSVHEVM